MEQKTLGTFIRERRQDLGLTQEQLAERVGPSVRQSEISRLEHDGIALPRRSRLEEIAAALDVSIGDLLVTTGWMDEENRASLLPDPAPLEDAVDDFLDHDPDMISAQSLATAMEKVTAAKELVAQTSAALEMAEEALVTAMNSLNLRGNPRGTVGLPVGIMKDWETSTAFSA